MASALDWLQQAPSTIQVEGRKAALTDPTYGSWGYAHQDELDQYLKSVSDAAGLQGYDWSAAKKAAADAYQAQTGSQYDVSTSWDSLIANIVGASGDPAINAAWQQVGPQVSQQAHTSYQNVLADQEARGDRYRTTGLAVLGAPLAAGGLSALLGGAGGAGAGAGAAAAAPTAAAPAASGTLGSGLTAGAAGAGGLSAGATGAAGIGTAGTAGSALAPGFFGAESLYPAMGGITAAGAGGAGAGVVGSTALGRLFGLGQTGQDILSIGGAVAPSLISAYGSNQAANKYEDLAKQYMEMGAPYRTQLSNISNDPNAFFQGQPAQLATDAVLRRLSTGGNPAANPYSQAQAINALWGEYGRERDRLAGYGGLTAYNQAAPGAAGSAISAGQTPWADIGYGVGNVLNPPKKTLADLLKNYQV